MQQKTLIAVGALVALVVLAVITLRAPEKGERTGARARPMAAIKAADVKELELSSNGGKDHATLKLDGAQWNLVAPLTAKADQQQLKTAVEQLEKISFGDLITENSAKFGDYEVDEAKGAHVVAKDGGGKVLFDAWLGKPSSGFTLLRPTGKSEVWQASGLFKYTYAKSANQLRDHTIVELKADDVKRLEVGAGDEKIALERVPPPDPKAAEAKWKLLSSTVKAEPLDDSVPNGIVQSLASLRAADFDDAAKPADVGLATPRVRLSVVTSGAPVTLLVGATKGDDSWVQLDGKPQIFLVQKYLLERLAVRPRDFRDKTIVALKGDDLAEIDLGVGAETTVLKHDGATWKGAKGVELDEAKVKGVVSAFERLQGSSFADAEQTKASGLAKPAGQITLRPKTGAPVVLKIGALKDGTDYFIQRSGSPDALLVKKFSVDRFWKKGSDLQKSPPNK